MSIYGVNGKSQITLKYHKKLNTVILRYGTNAFIATN